MGNNCINLCWRQSSSVRTVILNDCMCVSPLFKLLLIFLETAKHVVTRTNKSRQADNHLTWLPLSWVSVGKQPLRPIQVIWASNKKKFYSLGWKIIHISLSSLLSLFISSGGYHRQKSQVHIYQSQRLFFHFRINILFVRFLWLGQ